MQTLTYTCDGILTQKLRFDKYASSNKNISPPIHDHDSNRVLVVDDEPEICRLNGDVLMEIGYDVDLAGDGIAAWKLLEKNKYQLMITDNRMPRMSGSALLKKLHATRRFVPTIMTTGTMPDEQVTCQPWFQVVITLIKPYTLEELLMAVKLSVRKPAAIHLPV